MARAPSDFLDGVLWQCDRTRSAEARASLRAVAWSRGLLLGRECLLSPARDILSASEAAKEALSASLWRCRVCGKQFLTEEFLDRHLARRHPQLRLSGDLCLARLCGRLVPCVPRAHPPIAPVSSARVLAQTAPVAVAGEEWGRQMPVPDPDPCRSRAAASAARAACRSVVRECTRIDRPARFATRMRELRATLDKRLCDAALAVECTPVDERWRKFGPLAERGGETSSVNTFGWVVVAVMFAVLVLRVMGVAHTRAGESDPKRKRKRSARRASKVCD